MTTETDLLPLPEWMSRYIIPADGFEGDKDVVLADRMHDYARANVARAVEPLQAEIEALIDEATQHLRQAMSNGRKARAAQAEADNLRTEVERLRAEVARRIEAFADRAEQLEARAERLAKALRNIAAMRWWYGEDLMDAAGAARDALAQEDRND